jgi:type III restriction enzyme
MRNVGSSRVAKRERLERGNGHDEITDAEILREVMNTIGRKGRLGEQVRCVVSVSMLTEGWDANNVTHIMGLRAFGSRLICEQVIGRALRRLSYDADPETGLFRTEYADIMGIDGLNFGEPKVSPPQPPREVIHVQAVSPDRDHLEITFPRVEGYRTDFPKERIDIDFSKLEPYVLTPERVPGEAARRRHLQAGEGGGGIERGRRDRLLVHRHGLLGRELLRPSGVLPGGGHPLQAAPGDAEPVSPTTPRSRR